MLKLSDYDNQFNDDEYYLETKVELQALDGSANKLAPKEYIIKACSKQGESSCYRQSCGNILFST